MGRYAGKVTALLSAMAAAVSLSGCGSVPDEAVVPLMGLSWFMSEEQVREAVSESVVFEETREKEDEAAAQTLVDCSGVTLFDTDCSMTLCFTGQGLVGLNYHDVDREKNFAGWYGELEDVYGVPSERGSGIASWYSDPLGKNTAVYLFNLENEIQVSFYASGDTPDKSYGDAHIPSPEIRQPVVPFYEFGNIAPSVTSDPSGDSAGNVQSPGNEAAAPVATVRSGGGMAYSDEWYDDDNAEEIASAENAPSDTVQTLSSEKPESSQSMSEVSGTGQKPVTEVTTAASTKPKVTLPPVKVEKGDDYTLDNSLRFYMSKEEGSASMTSYKLSDSYRIDEPGEPWEEIFEYSGVTFRGKKCDAVLCYTSRGLVGINYFGPSPSEYSSWVDTIRGIYGIPAYSEPGYSAWERTLDGTSVVVCVFRLDDSVQISFFADDSGSETAK